MNERQRAYIDLAVTLTWREMIVRYKRSLFGVLWALADPALNVVVYLLVFGVVLDAGRGVANYPLFTLAGMLAWLFFSASLEQSASTLLEHAPLIRKMAFPTELLVVGVVIARGVTLLIGLALALALAAIAPLGGLAAPAWERLPYVALGVVLLLLFTLGIALVVAAVGLIFGDAQFLVRFGLRVAFYACPIVYPLARIPEVARPLYELNPLVATLWCFQAFSDPRLPPPSANAWASSIACALIAALAGWWSFGRLKNVVAELV